MSALARTYQTERSEAARVSRGKGRDGLLTFFFLFLQLSQRFLVTTPTMIDHWHKS